MQNAFKTTAELIPAGGGVYEVEIDGNLIFSKKELERFPEDGEIVRLIHALS